MSQGLVISDLHLFSRRSDGADLWSQAGDDHKDADTLVLNGDFFDFRWSHHPNEESSIAAAVAWVDRLLTSSRWRAVHYIFGNHDCLTSFQTRLEAFAADHAQLACHDHRLQIGRNLFLHGDCANRLMDAGALERYRDAWSRDRPRGAVRRVLYDGADALGLSRAFQELYFPRTRSVQRVAHHLNHVMPAWREDIDHCYFGHTHRPFRDLELEGVRFHNTGSGIRGMGFLPLTFNAQITNT